MKKKTETFLLLSLDDDKAKKLASVMSSPKAKQILDFLAHKSMTETELSQDLKTPIATIHYNLKLLTEGGLVTADEFHYSKKGREVLHYTLANKYIIIAPKSTKGLSFRIKELLPVVGIVSGFAIIAQIAQKYLFTQNEAIVPMLGTTAQDASMALKSAAPMMSQVTSSPQLPIGALILVGALIALVSWLVLDIFKGSRE